jgi:putative ABC transport system permease protein
VVNTSTRGAGRERLFLRWSWRDLRRHWIAVVAISLVIAIGTGVYAGLGSTATWRRQSNDASFAAVAMHDLRGQLSPGTFIDEGELLATVAALPDADRVALVDERLVVDSQVEVTVGGESLVVKSRLVGMDIAPGPTVDDLWVSEGDRPDPGSSPVTAVLEAKFADFHSLPPTGTVTVGGGHPVEYVGLGAAPEDFWVVGEKGSVLAEADLAMLYMDLGDAQELTGRTGQVNDVVLTLTDTESRDLVEGQLTEALAGIPGVSTTVTVQDEAEAFRILYEDIENDQRMWNAISALVLFAAAVAAFNLVSRIVEAQRREIGIGMALGVARWRLAIRPLLIGTQIAILGTIAGIGVGMLVGAAMKDLLESLLPLPHYVTPFQAQVYARAALLGLVVPIVASGLPVWRAVRVEPIEAIRTGHLATKSSRWTEWTSRISLPGSSLTLMPIRNLLRTPRRAVLTAIGVGAAVTALVAILSMLDSFSRTIDQGGDEVTKGNPDRMVVQLDTFYPAESDVVSGIRVLPTVGRIDVGLRIPVSTVRSAPDDELELILELIDLDQAAWKPTVIDGSDADPRSGLILARKAADDLGVDVGDSLILRHPTLTATGFSLTESDFPVAGIHPNPIRNFAFADIDIAGSFGLAGSTNLLQAYPAPGISRLDMQRELFTTAGVASTQAVAAISEAFNEALEQLVGILYITSGAVLVLALLIAYNSARITVDERQREHATMRAFGVPVRRVVGVVTRESILVGAGATVLGLIAGRIFLGWMLSSLVSRTVPDIGIEPHVSPATLLTALAVGVLAVALASVLLANRIRRMNIPDTLRVME